MYNFFYLFFFFGVGGGGVRIDVNGEVRSEAFVKII